MSKATRYQQKLFGSTGGTDQFAQFGSFAAGSPLRYSGATVTPDVIQALSNFLTGWKGAVIGNNAPLLEDMNSVCYLFAYQLFYLMQTGLAEYNVATTYYIGSLVNNGDGAIYVSLTDSNVGNPLSDSTNWAPQSQHGSNTPNTLPQSTTIVTGTSAVWPYLTIPNAKTLTVATGADLVGVTSIILTGTGNLTLQGTAICRIL